MELLSTYIDSLFQFTHPGRGATPAFPRVRPSLGRFNSRTPGGVRLCKLCLYSRSRRRFNSRTPGGVRRKTTNTHSYDTSFNSRTPGGVRQYGAKLPIMGRINKRNLRLAVLL